MITIAVMRDGDICVETVSGKRERKAAATGLLDWSEMTPEHWSALNAYWIAKTPEAEKAAYARMMELGFPDAYWAEWED
jgi:hypothetical protein